MKKLVQVCLAVLLLAGCKNGTENKKFTVTGDFKHAPDQKIFLEELFFSDKEPQVLDTADLKSGKFVLDAVAAQEGTYRIRLEKDQAAFLLINDKENIPFTADYDNLSMQTVLVNTPANQLLKNFIVNTSTQTEALQSKGAVLKQFTNPNPADSIYNSLMKEYDATADTYKKYLVNYIDTSSNAMVALFALGYSNGIEPEKLNKSIAGLSKRFPNNQAVATVVASYKTMMEKAKQQKQQPAAAQNNAPQIGDMAPEITMPDAAGKSFSLSSLKGKYVLVDFWASWCGPCRRENPNVVKAYNTFKNKNFTILGVSLDTDKQEWINAVKKDNLSWQHISNLKEWGGTLSQEYGFDAIPYNVLIDPQGKIIATSLRGQDLENKLAEVLK